MATEIYLTKVGMVMTEGTIAEWYVPDGGEVTEGEPLYALETDKVSVDIPAPATGVVRHVVDAGSTVAPASIIGYVLGPGEATPTSR